MLTPEEMALPGLKEGYDQAVNQAARMTTFEVQGAINYYDKQSRKAIDEDPFNEFDYSYFSGCLAAFTEEMKARRDALKGAIRHETHY